MTHILPVYAKSKYSFERGENIYLYDKNGKKYLDFASGIGVNSMGHCHPHLVKALQDQAAKLWHVSNMYSIQGYEELAERVTKASKFAHYMFMCNSGAEAVECGMKAIRKYHDETGNPHKYRIITFHGAFHGRTLGCISAAGKEKLMKGFEPAADGFDQVEFGNLEAVKKAINENTAGILVEPVQGEGGIRPCSDEFLQGLRKICDENNLILMFDGVQCGMGRTGKFFSHEWANVHPDISSSAKGIGSGFPVGACLLNKKVGDTMTVGSHGSTYAGNPLAVAVCHAVMDIMLAEGFLENVVEVGNYLMQGLRNLVTKYPNYLLEVRGKGLMIGLKINSEKFKEVKEFADGLREVGLLTAPAADSVVRFLPPLILTKAQADEGLQVLDVYLSSIK
ncbi:MAG: aspartate aminotransferase family protein [Rickettsiales bacterium]|nr:aspartate aminotransferase family protein [Rickettsiales bacterium]